MSAALRKLHAERRRYGIGEEDFRAILEGQIGRRSSKGISMSGANACIAQFRKLKPQVAKADKREWRERSDDPQVRKAYKLWGILRDADKVEPRYPDGFVRRMVEVDRLEFCTPAQVNIVIEGLKDWIKREGLGERLR